MSKSWMEYGCTASSPTQTSSTSPFRHPIFGTRTSNAHRPGNMFFFFSMEWLGFDPMTTRIPVFVVLCCERFPQVQAHVDPLPDCKSQRFAGHLVRVLRRIHLRSGTRTHSFYALIPSRSRISNAR